MKTYKATIRDGGIKAERTLEAADIEAACHAIERELREAEEVTAGNPDCEPRERWSAIYSGDTAECSLRGENADAQSWVKVFIEPEPAHD